MFARSIRLVPRATRGGALCGGIGAITTASAALLLLSWPSGLGATQQLTHTPMLGQSVRLDPTEAARKAAEERKGVPAQAGPGLEVSVWAPPGLVADPLAIDIDPTGVAYIVASPRSGQLLDIREHPTWVPLIHTFKTTEDLRVFFKRVMAPELSAENTWLPDSNGDGSRDWRDLTAIKERVYRLEDTNGDGVADLSRVVFEGFNEDVASDIAGGILVAGNDLYVTAAPDLWRLRDPNRDGVYEVSESLSHGYSIHPAFSGHDMSALTAGPDGRLYWKIGDIGMNVVDKSGRRWASPNQGAILRADPDGSNFEVFATGLRNTQEIAFDEHGNLVSVDNDGDHPGENERVVYITQGSDAGWRSTWQFGKYTDATINGYNVWMNEGLSKPQFPGQAAYLVPPVAGYKAGPSGFAYNPGTALDEQWRRHFFVTSFTGSSTSARVYAFQLNPKGAGFELGRDVEILRGVLSPGMRIGPEGRIWKLDSPAGARDPMRAEVKALLVASFESRALTDLRTLLAHADMRVRQKAQFELVRRRSAATLLSAVREDKAPLARLHAIWGLGQLARTDATQAATLVPFLRDADAEVRAQAAKTLGDVRARAATAALMPLLAGAEARPRFFAAEALGRIGDKSAIAAIVQMLADNDDRDVYLRHAGSAALASLNDPAALAALSTHVSRGARMGAVIALRRLKDAGVGRFLNDQDELVATEAARAVNDETGIAAALPALAAMLGQTRFTNEPLLRRAISANARLGTAEAAGRLAAFALRPVTTTPAPVLREEAIRALSVWMTPSRFDRVDGSELGTTQAAGRDATAARTALATLVRLLDQADTTTPIKLAVIDGLVRLEMKNAAPTLLGRLRSDSASPVRVAALAALQALSAAELGQAVRLALADTDQPLRMAAISAMAAMPIAEPEKVAHLESVITSGTPGEKQAAIEGLGKVAGANAQAALGRLLDQLAVGTIAAEVQLDVLDAASVSATPALLARLDQMKVGRKLENLAMVFPNALERGGSVQRGRQLVMNHPAAQCGRCHTVGNATATVGPSLVKIGGQLTRTEIVQSMLDPSARIAPGFGTVQVTLRSGQQVTGLLREETGTTLVFEDGTGARQSIAKTDVTARVNAPSSMPPMGLLLKPREVRDIIEYLATLR
jgi:quinoprotein glucose dehydrogenase